MFQYREIQDVLFRKFENTVVKLRFLSGMKADFQLKKCKTTCYLREGECQLKYFKKVYFVFVKRYIICLGNKLSI